MAFVPWDWTKHVGKQHAQLIDFPSKHYGNSHYIQPNGCQVTIIIKTYNTLCAHGGGVDTMDKQGGDRAEGVL